MNNKLTKSFILLALTSSVCITKTFPENKTGLSRIHAEGKYLKDDQGKTVYLAGYEWVDRCYRPKDMYFRQLSIKEQIEKCKQWGIKPLVWFWTNHHRWHGEVSFESDRKRLLTIKNGEYYLYTSTEEYINDYRTSIDEDMKLLNEAGFYVVLKNGLGPTQYGAAPETNPLTNPEVRKKHINYAVELMSRYYKYTNIIGYEIWNEPGWFGSKDINELRKEWSKFALDIAKAVHKINPEALIFVPGAGFWTYHWNIAGFWEENFIPEPNIVYSFDFYYYQLTKESFWKSYKAGDPKLGKKQLEDWLYQRAIRITDKGYPVICEEWGFFSGPTGKSGEMGLYQDGRDAEPDWPTAMQDFIDILHKYNVWWTYQSWGKGDSQTKEGKFVPYGRHGLFMTDKNGRHTLPTPKFNIWFENIKNLSTHK